jgi:hypothetical protein
MEYTTREIADKLRRYAHFLESEIARYEAMAGLIDIDSDAYIGLANELKQTREMQNYLWEKKERI